jgi:hypothetical protein
MCFPLNAFTFRLFVLDCCTTTHDFPLFVGFRKHTLLTSSPSSPSSSSSSSSSDNLALDASHRFLNSSRSFFFLILLDVFLSGMLFSRSLGNDSLFTTTSFSSTAARAFARESKLTTKNRAAHRKKRRATNFASRAVTRIIANAVEKRA